ncbi:hypothetical protein ACN27E_02065 [Mycobacterium sp. WMMD1722]|uniref:hypothetical protein n=1 Tax=Mycobacterium sp. WMMD1722 TaxID=3404117 RepID=UPI003BF523F5
MVIGKVIAAVGAIAVLTGIVGLLSPVSVDPHLAVVECGSVVNPDLSAARAHDDGVPVNAPVGGEVVVDADYTELCSMELEDRALWTLTLVVAGGLAVAGSIAYGLVTRRRHRSSAALS